MLLDYVISYGFASDYVTMLCYVMFVLLRPGLVYPIYSILLYCMLVYSIPQCNLSDYFRSKKYPFNDGDLTICLRLRFGLSGGFVGLGLGV